MANLRLVRFIKYVTHQRCFRLIASLPRVIGAIGGVMFILSWAFSQNGIFGSLTVQTEIFNFLGLVLAAELLIVLVGYVRDLWDNRYMW